MIIYLKLPKNFIYFSNEVYGFEDYVICSDMSIKMEIQKFISVERKKQASKQANKHTVFQEYFKLYLIISRFLNWLIKISHIT